MIMDSDSTPTDLTPKHVRAARALLAWSQQELAKNAGVATSTVADFERGHRTPVPNNAQAIRSALEAAGVRFLTGGAIIGPALPARARSERPGVPVKWIDVDDIEAWADRLDGAAKLPELVAHLIRATHGSAVKLRFPSDGGIRHSGRDGWTSTEQKSDYVPDGCTVWEVSTQRSGIAQKASGDYNNRTENSAPRTSSNATYIFVCARHWPRKEDWAADRRNEGKWRDVKVYDANDLVHWIELAPAVGLQLAERLGKRPSGVLRLENIWDEWSLATKWPLSEDLVLCDRDEDAAEVLRWLRGEPSVLSLQSTTIEEVVAFFSATIGMLPEDIAADYRERCLVVTEADAARKLVDAPAPLILILMAPDPGLAHRLKQSGHFVLQAYDDRPTARGEARALTRPSREGLAGALKDIGIPEARARSFARDSARNLAVLRRLIPNAPGRLPNWAKSPPPQALLAALLAGGWDDASEADKATLSQLAGQPYDDAIRTLAPYVGKFDSPLRKIGSSWRVASPYDAWLLLARHLTDADLACFEALAVEVLGAADPRYDLPPDERWLAAVHNVRPTYSGLLRHGVGEVLILLSLWGQEIATAPDAPRRADTIVSKLLEHADSRRWWSLSGDFRLLAEAAPEAFLSAIEDSLDRNDPPIRALFGTDGDGVFAAEHLSDLLWALESLAWSPAQLPRVSMVLARLDTIDVSPGRSRNRPGNSLRKIHLLWNPQTYATLDQRLRTLDLIRRSEKRAAWKLMLGVLPRGHDTITPSPQPRWRDYTPDQPEALTWLLIGQGAAAISDRILAEVGSNVEFWLSLLERIKDIAPDPMQAIAKLEEEVPRISAKGDRARLWVGVRKILSHHRGFPDANWTLPAEALERLDRIYDRLAPADPFERVAWLFEISVRLPKPTQSGWEYAEREADGARRAAAREIYEQHGVVGILQLAQRVETAGFIGKALTEIGLDDAALDKLLEASLRSSNSRERDVGYGIVIALFPQRKEPWAATLLARSVEAAWGDDAVLTILRALPEQQWTWDQAAQAGESIDLAYWQRTPAIWVQDNTDGLIRAIDKLISVGRARHAIHLAGQNRGTHLPSDLLVKLLNATLQQAFEKDRDGNELTMFQYYVTEIFKELDTRNDISTEEFAGLEWGYFPLLESSERPPKVLMRQLSSEPALFVEMLKSVFRPSVDSGIEEPAPENAQRAETIALQAYQLLDIWHVLPGMQDDGTIDGNKLKEWIAISRRLAKDVGREDVADDRIGKMLSASPMGADGVWPAEAVREALDLFQSKRMIEGFWVGKSNRRGVTTRMPGDGGEQERQEAEKYKRFAAALQYDYPHTAKALSKLAKSYENDAQREDESAERRDWEIY